jgi:hypothetical protein
MSKFVAAIVLLTLVAVIAAFVAIQNDLSESIFQWRRSSRRARYLSRLRDVDVFGTLPKQNDVLSYDAATKLWIPRTIVEAPPPGGGGSGGGDVFHLGQPGGKPLTLGTKGDEPFKFIHDSEEVFEVSSKIPVSIMSESIQTDFESFGIVSNNPTSFGIVAVAPHDPPVGENPPHVLSLLTHNSNAEDAGKQSGSVLIQTGYSASRSGVVSVATGNSKQNDSGNIIVNTGSSTEAKSGSLSFVSGEGKLGSGHISIRTGSPFSPTEIENGAGGLAGGISIRQGVSSMSLLDNGHALQPEQFLENTGINIHAADTTGLQAKGGNVTISGGDCLMYQTSNKAGDVIIRSGVNLASANTPPPSFSEIKLTTAFPAYNEIYVAVTAHNSESNLPKLTAKRSGLYYSEHDEHKYTDRITDQNDFTTVDYVSNRFSRVHSGPTVPDATFDYESGYRRGHLFIKTNSNDVYICIDPGTFNNAMWKQMTLT